MEKERRFIYVIGLCFVFILLAAFVLTLCGIINLKIIDKMYINPLLWSILHILMFLFNMFFLFSVSLKTFDKKILFIMIGFLPLCVLIAFIGNQKHGLIYSSIIPILYILLIGFIKSRKNIASVFLRCGAYTIITSIYQQISGFIKLNAFGLSLYECNILVAIIYSIDLYLFYLLIYMVVRKNGFLVSLEVPVRFVRFLKETCKEVLSNRQMADVSDLITKRQRYVFSFLVFGYLILQYIIIIGVNVLINLLLHFLGGFFIGVIELIIAGTALELFRLILGKTFHDDKPKICNIVSFIVFFTISRFAIPLHISLFVNICVAAIIAYIIHILVLNHDERMELKTYKENHDKFNLKTCTAEQLIERCRLCGFSTEDTELSIKLFVDKIGLKQAAQIRNIEEQSARNLKYNLSKQLNSIK